MCYEKKELDIHTYQEKKWNDKKIQLKTSSLAAAEDEASAPQTTTCVDAFRF